MRLIDIAWLAGIIEGEATLGFHHSREKTRDKRLPEISVKMTDKDIMQRIAKLLGAKLYGPYIQTMKKRFPNQFGHYKSVYHVVFRGKKAIGLLFTIYTFLGERRRERAQELITQWKAGAKPLER